MSTVPTPPAPEELPEVGDRNVERLLARAYQPEVPDAGFAEALQERLQATAQELAATRKPADASPRRFRWAGFYGVAASVAGLLLLFHGMGRGPSSRPSPAPDIPKDGKLADQFMKPLKAPPTPRAPEARVGETIRTGARERLRRLLPDGSVLYVNADTTLHVDAGRRLTLDRGEVFVEVTPRPAADRDGRFVIHTPERQVTALGTKFAVRVGRDETGILVTQGKVKVSDFDRPVQAGQELEAAGGRKELRPALRASYLLAWAQDLVKNSEAPLVRPNPHAGGALLARDPFGQEMNLTLRRFHIDVYIEDGFARTTIDQTYFNPSPSRLEGIFYFPLPADASLSRLAMYVDGKLREGGMAERQQARNAFESIVSKQRDPALLEWLDGNTFRMRVFPLEPRQEKRIILAYTQRLPGLYAATRYTFPGGHSIDRVGEWSFRATVRKGAGLHWTSPTHEFRSRKTGDDLVLETAARNARPDQDVILNLEDRAREDLRTDAARFALAVQQDEKGRPEARYLALRYRPVLRGQPRTGPRDWIILFETSGDRNPLLARTQVEIVRSLLGNAEHADRFCLLTAGTRVRSFAPEFKPATVENVRAGLRFLERSHLAGALDLEQALREAARWTKGARNPYLVHVGAGLAALGERKDQALAGLLPESVPYVGVAVGKRWSRGFMKAAADRSGGYFTQINPDDSIAWRTFDLMAVLKAPRLLNVQLRDDTGKHVYLADVASISQGEELCAIARLPLEGDLPRSVTVRGLLDGKPVEKTFAVKLGPKDRDAGYLSRTWARLEIDRLLAADATKNKEQIIALSKAMYVMSPFTSLLVLENDAMHEQFKIDFGRKDHWAPYECPKEIKAITEEPAGPKAVVRKKPERKPTAAEVLKTIIVRVPPRWFTWDRNQADRFEGLTFMTAQELYSGVFYNVPDSLRRRSLFSTRDPAGKAFLGYQDQVYNVREVPERPPLDDRGFTELLLRVSRARAGLGEFPPGDEEGEVSVIFPGELPVISSGLNRRQPGGLVDPSEVPNVPNLGGFNVMGGWMYQPGAIGFSGLGGFSGGFGGIGGIGGFGGAGLAGVGGLGGVGGFGGIGGISGFGGGFTANGIGGFGSGLGGMIGMGGLGLSGFSGLGGVAPLGLQTFSFPATQFPDPPAGAHAEPLSLVNLMDLNTWLDWGLGAKTMLYERPGLRGDERAFKDLTLYAPGLNTTEADVLAVLEAEAGPRPEDAPGTIDPAARDLIEKARRAGWQTITQPANGDQGPFKVCFDGQERFTYERILPWGLKEIAVCDGVTLWHLYPEIGLGSRRAVSRFHRAEFARLVPWLLPPAEDLARGADVKLIAPRVVAVIPKGDARAAQVQLVFAEDGRLAERRLVEMPPEKVLYREVYGKDGLVRCEGAKQKAGLRLDRRPAVAPNLNPNLEKLVVVPMPLRTPEFINQLPLNRVKNKLLDYMRRTNNEGDFGSLREDAAIGMIASASFIGSGAMAETVARVRFWFLGDNRVGLQTLLMATKDYKKIDNPGKNWYKPLAKYLAAITGHDAQLGRTLWVEPKEIGGPPKNFLRQLVNFRLHCIYLNQMVNGTLENRKSGLSDCLYYFGEDNPSLFRWALLDLLQRNAGPRNRWIFPELARQYGKLIVPGSLSYEARYEQARCLARAGQTEQARKKFMELFQAALRVGRLPGIDRDFYRVFNGDDSGREELQELLNRAAARFVASGRRSAVICLAWQCFQLGDRKRADALYAQAFADAPDAERRAVSLTALQYLCYTRQFARADELVQTFLGDREQTGAARNDKELIGDSYLWRLASLVAGKRGRTARAAACLEKALDMEYEAQKGQPYLIAFNWDYARLLGLYQRLAKASSALGQPLPSDFTDRVMRAADRWRAAGFDDWTPCITAGNIFLKLGRKDLAWEYFTTPIGQSAQFPAALLAGEPLDDQDSLPGSAFSVSASWSSLGMMLKAGGELEMAERAYAEAARAGPSTPQVLWDRAVLLQQLGKNEEARQLFQEIVEGNWPSGTDGGLVQQAEAALNKD